MAPPHRIPSAASPPTYNDRAVSDMLEREAATLMGKLQTIGMDDEANVVRVLVLARKHALTVIADQLQLSKDDKRQADYEWWTLLWGLCGFIAVCIVVIGVLSSLNT